MKFFLFLFLLPFLTVTKTEKLSVDTNACCETAKYILENTLRKVEGIKRAELDLTTKKIKVKYDPAAIEPATIRQAVAATGFSADEVPPRPKARQALPVCCRDEAAACKKVE